VVLLDIGLPGIDGYEVARQLNAPSPGKKPVIIAITGYASEEDRRRSAEAGMHLHLTKPVDPEQLRAILERVERAVSW
jgi:two-component system OmpR family response regulator